MQGVFALHLTAVKVGVWPPFGNVPARVYHTGTDFARVCQPLFNCR